MSYCIKTSFTGTTTGAATQSREEVAMDIFENKNRVIALTEVGGAKVSTVHLVINHAFEPGQLLIFETMVFGGRLTVYSSGTPPSKKRS